MNRKLALLSFLTIFILTFSLLRPSVARAEEETPPEPAVTEPITVPEILERAPEGTGIVVVNAEGGTEPMATVDAAEIIANSDPVWCPDGVLLGDPTCTTNQANVTDLIAYLLDPDADPLTPTPYAGDGVIFFQEGTYGGAEASVLFDATDLPTLGNLTFWGGWDLVSASGTYGTQIGTQVTTFTVPVNIFWNNNVTLRNIVVSGSTGDGLVVQTIGDITLDTVDASGNALTGAYLDTCLYGQTTPGQCAGDGVVTITTTGATIVNLFDDNGGNGLVIDSGGMVDLYGVEANGNGRNGAFITAADDDGTGNVVIENSDFIGNNNGAGLNIYADGTISLTDVTAEDNNFGTILDTTPSTTGSGITVDSSDFLSNDWTGLHAESNGTITLTGVSATGNGTNGTYLVALDDVTITGSSFNGNVLFDYPTDPGLFVESNGNIILTDVIATDNLYGAGVVLKALEDGYVSIQTSLTGTSTFNGNGTFGIQGSSNGGDITLDNITASYNAVKGAYLSVNDNGAMIGDLFITDSTFVENGSYGFYAAVNQGNITIDGVTVTGNDGIASTPDDDLTNIGAFLAAHNGGNISVTDSLFELNTQVGMQVVGSNTVDLVDVVANQNGGNGAEAYSTYTFGCRCPGEVPVNVAVSVDGGEFTNNTGYGLFVMPGPAGSLTFVTPPTTAVTDFTGNTLGDTIENYGDPEFCSDPCACQDCTCDQDNSTKLEPKIVQVPFQGGEPVLQDCTNFSSTILQLPDGTWVKFGCPFTGYSRLEGVNEEDLPAGLGAGITFLSGIDASMFAEDGITPVLVNPVGSLVLSFKLPEDQRIRSFSVLYWDPGANNGAGTWISMPPYEVGTTFPLNPDDPADLRVISSGVREVNGMVKLTVNFPGLFVLVTP